MSDKPITIDIIGNIAPFQSKITHSDMILDELVVREIATKKDITYNVDQLHILINELIEDLSVVEKDVKEVVGEAEVSLKSITKKAATFKKRINLEMGGVLSTIRSVVSTGRSVFSALGGALDPLQESMVMAIEVGLTSALAIHRQMEAATFGLSGALTVGLSGLAIAMAGAAVLNTSRGMEDAKAMAQRSVAALQQIESTLTSQQIWNG